MPDADPYLALVVDGFRLDSFVGSGKIGSVYKATRTTAPHDSLACKVVPEQRLKSGWQRELAKVALLRGVPDVVQYFTHGADHDHNQRPFTYTFWNYVDGHNLRDFLVTDPEAADINFIAQLLRTLLAVLHACTNVGIAHGDLHEGNILISHPDPRLPNSPRRLWIADFGYGGSNTVIQPKDDFRQTFGIVSRILDRISDHALNSRDRILFDKLVEFLRKRLLESDPTQGPHVRNPALLLADLEKLERDTTREADSVRAGASVVEPGDYLYAEALGYRTDEWKTLFVPDFLAAKDLLSRNNTVLTGARGCGKTMSFRRLTAFMDRLIEQPSGVDGSDTFVGFYLNCRDLIEAFQWLPRTFNPLSEQQLMHYFHLLWVIEVVRTIQLARERPTDQDAWLGALMADLFPADFPPPILGEDVFAHAASFLERQKELCRNTPLGSPSRARGWSLARIDLLDVIQQRLDTHLAWIDGRPFYLFLDDYSLPLVDRRVQRLLNPILFKRRDRLFFKVSTEASNSFFRVTLNNKLLEPRHDFELIDLATEALHQRQDAKVALLDKVFRPRIDRHPALRGQSFGLRDILGTMGASHNQFAWQMRTKKNVRSHLTNARLS